MRTSLLAAVLSLAGLPAVAGLPALAQTLPIVVQQTTTCATSVDGSLVGIRNPQAPPVVSTTGTGTLPASWYYIELAWYDAAAHVTLVSPETSIQLDAQGSITVSAPTSGTPALAAGFQVFMATSSGAETLQGSATVHQVVYSQSTPLITGTAPPVSNTTLCQQVANDAGWPTGTGYNVSITDQAGNTLPGYPMMWQLLGPGNTINLNQGLPLYNNTVTYPVPILARPYNHVGQSISGPLSLSGYNLTQLGLVGIGTSVPGWGVDAEAAPNNPLLGEINASKGYLIGGTGGSAGWCLASDGTLYDTAVQCVTSLPTLYYQTVVSNGTTAAVQRPALDFGPLFTVTDASWTGGNDTAIGLNAPGTGNAVATYSSTSPPSTSTNCAKFDGNANVVPASGPCVTYASTATNCLTTACAGGSTYSSSGGTYTNGAAYPVTELVTATLASSSGTGGQYTLTSSLAGLTGPSAEIANECANNPPAFISLRVPPGASFTVTPNVVATCSPAGTWAITTWIEVSQ